MQCPFCHATVRPEDDKCRFCRKTLPCPGVPAEHQQQVREQLSLARARRLSGRYDEARTLALEMIKLAPACAAVYAFLGELAAEQKLEKEALNWYRKAVQCDGAEQDYRDRYDALIRQVAFLPPTPKPSANEANTPQPPPPMRTRRSFSPHRLLAGILVILAAGVIWWHNLRLAGQRPGPLTPLPAGKHAGEVRRNTRDAAEVVWVPGGVFRMGSEKGQCAIDEYPAHRVVLAGYWIYRTEVTVGQFRMFCRATRRRLPDDLAWETRDDAPIANVTWSEARDYARWVGGRLPTEAQWEKAARGTDARSYPWGNTWDPARCHSGRQAKEPMPVGAFPTGAGPYGALDLCGNVGEWCADWYAADYYRVSPSANPPGAASGSHRVVRGGSWWDSDPRYLRGAMRNDAAPDTRAPNLGFRCIISPSG